MGYTTEFMGELKLSRKLTEVEKTYINTFSESRRMARDVNKLMEIFKGKYGTPTPKDNTPEGIYGRQGEYFVNTEDGESRDGSIIDFNTPPGLIINDGDFNVKWDEMERRIAEENVTPSLFCRWIIESDEENDVLAWDGGEKFYYYIEWLKYLIFHFFEPWGVKLNGSIDWRGDDFYDVGEINVVDNIVNVIEN